MEAHQFDGITDEMKKERNGQSIIVLPSAQVSFYQKDALRFYMGIGIGGGYYTGFDNMTGNFSFEIEFVPIGIEYGRKVFCFAEGCLGTATNWVHGGIGFRF